MADSSQPPRPRRAQMLGELIGRVIDPVTRQRGFAATELLAAWPEIVGARYADCTRPERIVWPKGEEMEGAPALLVLRVDGPRAVLIQHEAGQIVERINAFMGYAAIGHLRILQAPVRAVARAATPAEPALDQPGERKLQETVAAMPPGPLKTSLEALGRHVIAEARRPHAAANKRHI
ncbi:MAG TPA: DciA family protein [Bauldia sp.]|nr:DciA family protein [Bauldia sp.]